MCAKPKKRQSSSSSLHLCVGKVVEATLHILDVCVGVEPTRCSENIENARFWTAHISVSVTV